MVVNMIPLHHQPGADAGLVARTGSTSCVGSLEVSSSSRWNARWCLLALRGTVATARESLPPLVALLCSALTGDASRPETPSAPMPAYSGPVFGGGHSAGFGLLSRVGRARGRFVYLETSREGRPQAQVKNWLFQCM